MEALDEGFDFIKKADAAEAGGDTAAAREVRPVGRSVGPFDRVFPTTTPAIPCRARALLVTCATSCCLRSRPLS